MPAAEIRVRESSRRDHDDSTAHSPGSRYQRDTWCNLRQWMSHPDADAVIAELDGSESLTAGRKWYGASVRR